MADRKVVRDLSPMGDAENRLGIEPVELLLAERRDYIDQVADLRAKYGPFGTFDHLRKIELARLAGLVRAQMKRDGVKVTESELDQIAHGHPDYMEFITTATMDRARWIKLEAKINDIDTVITRGQAVARFVTAEARLS